MRVSKMMLLLPALGLLALPMQPVSAEHCTKTTTFESSVIIDNPVLLEPSTTTYRVIERPVMVTDTMASPLLIERPVMVERRTLVEKPVVIEKRVVVDRPVMMEKRIIEHPIIVNQEKRHLLRFSLF